MPGLCSPPVLKVGALSPGPAPDAKKSENMEVWKYENNKNIRGLCGLNGLNAEKTLNVKRGKRNKMQGKDECSMFNVQRSMFNYRGVKLIEA